MNQKPLVAITMGDPAGIGPEVTAKALTDESAYSSCRPFIIGSADAVDAALDLIGSRLRAHPVSSLGEVMGEYGAIDVMGSEAVDYAALEQGTVSAEAGRASVEWLLKAGELAASGDVAAIATAPINKEACGAAGYKDIGHTELYQRQSGAERIATMLMARNLRVVHLTTHKPLSRAAEFVTKENVLATIRLTDDHFRKWGFPEPRIGVAALNPHGGDGGLIGDEELTAIGPAVNEATEQGIDATGPVPADTIFNQAIDGRYDVVLAMYHDQGHIPIKAYDWERSTTLNLGLPFIRTSVDHGTAFDIAGKGVADHTSMLEAIKAAVSLAADGRLPYAPVEHLTATATRT